MQTHLFWELNLIKLISSWMTSQEISQMKSSVVDWCVTNLNGFVCITNNDYDLFKMRFNVLKEKIHKNGSDTEMMITDTLCNSQWTKPTIKYNNSRVISYMWILRLQTETWQSNFPKQALQTISEKGRTMHLKPDL